MKKTIVYLIGLILGVNAFAQSQQELFPYPQAPEEKTLLSERCNFIVDHFWERCNLKQSFSSVDRLEKAFSDWVALMPYATADTVFMSIDRFLNDVAKTGGDNLVTVGKMAEKYTYTDSADIYSEELYFPFAKFIAEYKKTPKAYRPYFQSQYKILNSSSVDKVVPPFDFVTPSGDKGAFGDVVASRIVIFFSDPDCLDCSLVKARLAADYNLNRLIDENLVKIVSIYPGEPTAKWREDAAKYPENWIVGASDDIDTYFKLDDMPAIYYLDAKHKVLAKDVNVDSLIVLLQKIYQQMHGGE